MPFFDYQCQCGHQFEELVTSSDTPDALVRCPACGQPDVHRLFSAPAIGGKKTDSANPTTARGCGHAGFT